MNSTSSTVNWQEDALILIGSTNYDYVESLKAFIENESHVWTAWSFRIRDQWRNSISNRLSEQGKFPIFFYISKASGGSGTIEYVGKFTEIRMSDKPINTPDSNYTKDDELEFPTDAFSSFTWFKITEIEHLDILELETFRDIDTEDPMRPSQLRSSFGYSYLPTEIEDTYKMEQQLTSTPISVEKDLRKYIVANLDTLEKGLTLYRGDHKIGEELSIDLGKMRIDVLALDKIKNYVVIELKAGIADLTSYSQISSYMGWIKQNFIDGEKIRGIIVASEFDDKLKYAISIVPNIVLKKYNLKFEFKDINN